MKSYPSIPQSVGTAFRELPNAYVFDKPDGSNLCYQWNKKQGWYKFGTRNRLFDESDWQFGRAISMFKANQAEPLEKIFRDQRWQECIVYCEHVGPSSFAGNHHLAGTSMPWAPLDPGDQMQNQLFDVAPYKQGILGPAEFVKLFGEIPQVVKFLGRHNWTRGFVERIWNNDLPGITFEGVIGKTGSGKDHDLVMAKAKTELWINKVKAKFAPAEAEQLIKS